MDTSETIFHRRNIGAQRTVLESLTKTSEEAAHLQAAWRDILISDADALPDDVIDLYGTGPDSLAVAMLRLERAQEQDLEARRELRRTMQRIAARRRGIVQ